MNTFDDVVRDLDGVIVAGAIVYVYDSAGGLAALLESDGVTSKPNPLTSDDKGQVKAWLTADGFYTAEYFWGARKRYVRANILLGSSPITQAEDAAASAEVFALAIQLLGAGIIYDTSADGVALVTGVAPGEYFVTWESSRVRLYLNNAGSALVKAEFATEALLSLSYSKSADLAGVGGAALVGAATGGTVEDAVQKKGRATAIAGSKMAIRWLRDSAAFPLEDEASIWAGKVATDHGISATFTSADGQAGSPSNGLFVMANNNGCVGDVVAGMFDAVARANSMTVFGANIIARGTGKTGCKFVGAEIDILPSSSDSSISANSIGLAINIFNKALPGPAVQTGTVGGGTFANGFILGGLATTATGLAIEASSSADSLLNTTVGTFTTVALLLGNDQKRGIRLSGTSTAHAFIYNDTSNNVRNVLGSGSWIWRNNANTASLVSIADSAGQAVFNLETSAGEYRVNGTKVVGARGSAITAPTGGATIDAEARTAIGTIISRLQAHGLIT